MGRKGEGAVQQHNLWAKARRPRRCPKCGRVGHMMKQAFKIAITDKNECVACAAERYAEMSGLPLPGGRHDEGVLAFHDFCSDIEQHFSEVHI